MQNRIKENYLFYKKNGIPKTFRVDFHILSGCNFRCVMCDNWKNTFEINFSEADFKRVILSLVKNYNCDYIRFHGQEPTLYKDLDSLILFSKKLGVKVAIKTNASLLTSRRLIQIIKSGLDELYISIDAPYKEIHDSIRGIASFDQIISVFQKAKHLSPSLPIYINSVVMQQNFKVLPLMIDLAHTYAIDRVSFVFLNDKNRKDILDIQLSEDDFFSFFQYQVVEIYKKSMLFGIPVDFSPFLYSLIGEKNDHIIKQLESNFSFYKKEIKSFLEGKYGKFFYDNYGCFGPLDHASINFNGDMYGCCVVERDSKHAVGNIIPELTKSLWNEKKYLLYRQRSDTACSYADKCASNFFTRKKLFKDIYLDDSLYPKNTPYGYYRYLKSFQREDLTIKNTIQINKLRALLLHFYEVSLVYKKFLHDSGITKKDIENFSSLDFLKRIPGVDKTFLESFFLQKYSAGIPQESILGKTSGDSGKAFQFVYPLNFKRYVKQVALFSEHSDFTFSDTYFSVTPLNCNHMIQNQVVEPSYVKKVYINISDFSYNFDQITQIQYIFENHKNIFFLQGDSKYLLYIVLAFEKYKIALPKLRALFLTYSYTNKNLRLFLEKKFQAQIFDTYGSSEVGPIGYRQESVFGDNLIFEKDTDGQAILTDLDNFYTPFIRYKNGDIFSFDENSHLDIIGKLSQNFLGKSLFEIDTFFESSFPNIIFYQFIGDTIFYFSEGIVDTDLVLEKCALFFGKKLQIETIKDGFFELGSCSKFKTILS